MFKEKNRWDNSVEKMQAVSSGVMVGKYPVHLDRPTLQAEPDNTHILESPPQNTLTVALNALADWNHYLITGDESCLRFFLSQTEWLIKQLTPVDQDASGWLVSSTQQPNKRHWLSASTQGCGLSVLLRAYQHTHTTPLLTAIALVLQTFERDILDGGINTPIGADGKSVFFEDRAVYPATHQLEGCLYALIALHEYVALTSDERFKQLLERCHHGLHLVLNEYDTGYWTQTELLQQRLASPAELTRQTQLLAALAGYCECTHCATIARRWQGYQQKMGTRLYSMLVRSIAASGKALFQWRHRRIENTSRASEKIAVCVAVPSFPVMGGVLTVLEGIEQVMQGIWQIEYITQHVGPQPGRFIIHRFGTARTSPWHFPLLWLYVASGFSKILSLLKHGAGYQIILPQDGIYTSAFCALAARIAGVRVICIDHGDLSLFIKRNLAIYQAEYRAILRQKGWSLPLYTIARCCLEFYWPSRFLLARISAQLVDHYLIPGVAGDGVEEICAQLGIPASRITRYPSMIDIERHSIPDPVTRDRQREEKGLAADAIVIALICRLAPEKGLDIALENLERALIELAPEISKRVRVVIAGDGPLRSPLESEIDRRKLSQTCLLWGELSATEVITLLGLSDIFLYTSLRGACFAMAILEAMASQCAVIASTEPVSNATLLAEGRGIAVPAGDRAQTSAALVRLCSDRELSQRMGKRAREYIATYHTGREFRRTLLRASIWNSSVGVAGGDTDE